MLNLAKLNYEKPVASGKKQSKNIPRLKMGLFDIILDHEDIASAFDDSDKDPLFELNNNVVCK